MKNQQHSVGIIGAGFCGLMTSIHLLQMGDADLKVFLIDPVSKGRGIAYRPGSLACLLNVPVERMGAWPEHPDGFLKWLQDNPQTEGSTPQPGDFVPRDWFGKYLECLYDNFCAQALPEKFTHIRAEVEDLQITETGVSLILADGETLKVDQVVLASGVFPPNPPNIDNPDFFQTSDYVGNPWSSDSVHGLDPEQKILILGSGLTMVDVVLMIKEQGFKGRIEVVSPHGYLPLPHKVSEPWPDYLHSLKPNLSQLELLRLIRQELKAAADQGVDWRSVIDALRPYVPSIWQSWSLTERRRFMRHLRHLWGVHRHRLPAEIYLNLQDFLAKGSLRLRAGKVLTLEQSESGVQMRFWDRNLHREVLETGFQRVINCTGPCGDYRRIQSPLIQSLLRQGLIQPDPMRLGVLANSHGALLNQQGHYSQRLFILGSALRSLYWESTAVPELRIQARNLARFLLSA